MPECQHCGGHVTRRFQRVFGSPDGEVFACHDCASGTDIRNGAAAGLFEES